MEDLSLIKYLCPRAKRGEMEGIMNEIQLFVIWSNGKRWSKKILSSIGENFDIMNIYHITWDKELFTDNLIRFYRYNKPAIINKVGDCGEDDFLAIIVRDMNPIYMPRATSSGTRIVNTKMFDLKEVYRKMTGGGFKIHGTTNTQEALHDISFLIGEELEKYLTNTYVKEDKCIEWTRNVVGLKEWKSIDEVFYLLNKNIDYCILRNFENLPKNHEVGKHSDIDLLVANYNDARYILNSIENTPIRSRVQNSIVVKNEKINFDLRFVGDNYYDINWEKNILLSRERYRNFYIPNQENYYYSLLYHVLIQKKHIAVDYYQILNVKNKSMVLNNVDPENLLFNKLYSYLQMKNYKIIEPIDCSVYVNDKYFNEKKSAFRYVESILNRLYIVLRRILDE